MPTVASNLAPEKPDRPAVPSDDTLDTSNQFAVIRSFDEVLVCGVAKLHHPLSREQALNLAAWLIAVADPEDSEGVLNWTLDAIFG